MYSFGPSWSFRPPDRSKTRPSPPERLGSMLDPATTPRPPPQPSQYPVWRMPHGHPPDAQPRTAVSKDAALPSRSESLEKAPKSAWRRRCRSGRASGSPEESGREALPTPGARPPRRFSLRRTPATSFAAPESPAGSAGPRDCRRQVRCGPREPLPSLTSCQLRISSVRCRTTNLSHSPHAKIANPGQPSVNTLVNTVVPYLNHHNPAKSVELHRSATRSQYLAPTKSPCRCR